MIEIERKFLVKSSDFKTGSYQQTRIIQGFLNTDPERTVRVRINGKHAFITIKGISSKNGLSRFEWEKEIPVVEAEVLLDLCEPGKIEKVRYLVKNDNHTFEVDEFFGKNLGLIIAEIELNKEDEIFVKPSWLGEEVTGDVRYYNSQLSKDPYINWKKDLE
ncbi:CYTH domain-containing protein [Antarcticibacterium arcticum]|nr:CYTH domain-containing protein [Antarcticibacterium arcticum]